MIIKGCQNQRDLISQSLNALFFLEISPFKRDFPKWKNNEDFVHIVAASYEDSHESVGALVVLSL